MSARMSGIPKPPIGRWAASTVKSGAGLASISKGMPESMSSIEKCRVSSCMQRTSTSRGYRIGVETNIRQGLFDGEFDLYDTLGGKPAAVAHSTTNARPRAKESMRAGNVIVVIGDIATSVTLVLRRGSLRSAIERGRRWREMFERRGYGGKHLKNSVEMGHWEYLLQEG